MSIAITGGIGSGKSFICQRLASRGVAVYDCDRAAKRLMRSDKHLQQQLAALVDGVVAHGQIDKARLAQYILAAPANAQKVNALVHPAVADDFRDSPYTWLESALLFAGDFAQRAGVRYVVCVAAPLATRQRRIMTRDTLTAQQAQAWIDAQMSQEELLRRADFVIYNDDDDDVERQIDCLMNEITNNKQL